MPEHLSSALTLLSKILLCVLGACPQDATSSNSKVGKDVDSIRKSKAMLEGRNYVKVGFYVMVVAT